MAKVSTFGIVRIAAITAAATGNGFNVKLEQDRTSTYTGGSNALQRALGQTGGGATYNDTRSKTLWVQDASSITEGQEMPELHIVRYKHSTPQWDGHTASKDGSFISSEAVERVAGQEEDTIDLRVFNAQPDAVADIAIAPAVGAEVPAGA